MSSSTIAAIWDSLFLPRELHSILKYKLTAPNIDTSISTLDASDLLSDLDFAFLNLAKIASSVAEIILHLTPEIRDAACIYYLFSHLLQVISNDPDLTLDKKIHIITNFPTQLKSTTFKLDGVGCTDVDRQLFVTFPKLSAFFTNIVQTKYQSILHDYIEKTSELHIKSLQPPINPTPPNSKSNNTNTTNTTTTTTNPSLTNTTNSTTNQDDSIQSTTTTPTPQPQPIQQLLPTSLYSPPYHKDQIISLDDYNERCMLSSGLLFECIDQLCLKADLIQNHENTINTSLLSSSTGLFIQKVANIRNYRKNLFISKCTWPKEIWGLYAQSLDWFAQYSTHIRSYLCLNHMILDTFKHGIDAIKYLSTIQHHQPTFRFIAIQVLTAFVILSELYNNTLVFVGDFQPRVGLLCDITLNTTDFTIAKGFIYNSLLKIDFKCLDPELDPIFTSSTISLEEIAKSTALYQEYQHYLQLSKEFCLGYQPITTGWSTLLKWLLVGAITYTTFIYITDNVARELPHNLSKVESFRHGKKQQKRSGFRYQKTHIDADEFIPRSRQLQSVDNIMRRSNNMSHDPYPTEHGDIEDTLARAEAFLARLEKDQEENSGGGLSLDAEFDALRQTIDSLQDTDDVELKNLKQMLSQTDRQDWHGKWSPDADFWGRGFPAGYTRDLILTDEPHAIEPRPQAFAPTVMDKLPSTVHNKNELRGGSWYRKQEDIPDRPAFIRELKDYDGTEEGLKELLGLHDGTPLQKIDNTEFFELIQNSMRKQPGLEAQRQYKHRY